MRTDRLLCSIVLIMLLALPASAQQQSTLYYMNLPQKHLLNPALRSSNGFYLGLPGISGVSMNFNTNFIGFSDVFRMSESGDSVISVLHPDFDTDGFLKKIKKINYINPSVNIQTFGLGFRAGKDLYIFLDVNEKIDAGFSIPGSLFELALRGNEDFIGKEIDFSPLDANFVYYREFAAGFSKNITPKLRIGVRGKMLTGIASMSVDTRKLGVEVLEDYSHKMTTDMTVNISGPVTVYLNDDNGIDSLSFDDSRFSDPAYFLKPENTGFGFDIGAVYSVTPRLSVSAAVNGFGVINWKRDISTLTANNEFLFSGFDMSSVIDGTRDFDEMAEELLDSLKNSFTIADSPVPFKTLLPGTLSLGAAFDLSKSLSVGFVSNTTLRNGDFRNSLMLSANANFGTALSAGISYTAINNSYDNLGFGMAFRLGIFQLYTIADKIPLMYNRLIISEPGDGSPDLILPDKWNTLTLRVGLNLVFGNKERKRSDRPMIVTDVNK
jgi:hypothetical protein